MATLIFDFDDTLFNTEKLKKDIFKKIESFGVSKKVIEKSYKLTKEKFKHYTPKNHISVINESKNIKISKSQIKEIDSIDLDLYKNEEANKILLKLFKKHYLILLTIGEEGYQKFKINKSGVSSYFHEIHIIPEKKENFIMNKKFSGNIYFINDKKDENETVRKMFPLINVIDIKIKKGSLNRLPLNVLL